MRTIHHVGLFGGSFNPPHRGHVSLCKYALQNGIDEIIVIPSNNHPLKNNLTSFEHRMRMSILCLKACFDSDRIKISNIEKRKNLSFMRDTIREVKKEHFEKSGEKEISFRLLIGSDILDQIHKWKYWDEVEKSAPPFVIPRLGELSSTEIRERILKDEPTDDMLVEPVLKYIQEFELYKGEIT